MKKTKKSRFSSKEILSERKSERNFTSGKDDAEHITREISKGKIRDVSSLNKSESV